MSNITNEENFQASASEWEEMQVMANEFAAEEVAAQAVAQGEVEFPYSYEFSAQELAAQELYLPYAEGMGFGEYAEEMERWER